MIRLKYQETKEEVSASPPYTTYVKGYRYKKSWKVIILISGFRSYYEGAHRQKFKWFTKIWRGTELQNSVQS
jgi:hypothetical protein